MTKEMRELLQHVEQTKAQVRALLGENKVAEAEKLMEDVRALQAKAKLMSELEDNDTEDAGVPLTPAADEDKDLESAYRGVFLRGLRRQRLSGSDQSIVNEYVHSIQAAVMHEGGVQPAIPDGDVGMLVPQDVQTKINTIMRTLNPLSEYVRVETVTTASGSRVLERDENMTPLAVVEEYGAIQETDNPQFDGIPYKLAKRAGFLPLTKELLSDSDQNIVEYVSNWISRKVVVTHNTLITALIAGMAPVPLADLDAVKKVLNVTLDPAISATAAVLTNQDGYHWLDTQVDGNGRYLLVDDITQPGRKLLFGRPVYVTANRYLPSTPAPNATAPIILGNGKQLLVLFTAGRHELTSTTEGGDAWRRASTELRVISRDDVRQWDTGAAVHGRLAL